MYLSVIDHTLIPLFFLIEYLRYTKTLVQPHVKLRMASDSQSLAIKDITFSLASQTLLCEGLACETTKYVSYFVYFRFWIKETSKVCIRWIRDISYFTSTLTEMYDWSIPVLLKGTYVTSKSNGL